MKKYLIPRTNNYYRMVLALAFIMNTFLHGDLMETVCIKPPLGYPFQSQQLGYVCGLKKEKNHYMI